jgi:hypothetical protein
METNNKVFTIDSAAEFVRSFIEKEYKVHLAQHDATPEAEYEARKEAAEAYLDISTAIYINFYRGEITNVKKWLRENKDTLESISPRTLFKIARYEHPKYGQIFAAYMGGEYNYTQNAFHDLFFIKQVEGKLLIVSHYGGRFEYWSGDEFEKLGKPVEVKEFEKPKDLASLVYYSKETIL